MNQSGNSQVLNIVDESELFKHPDESTSRLDSSFNSFVNPTETAGEQDVGLEMVFHNKALFKIIGDMSQKELDNLL